MAQKAPAKKRAGKKAESLTVDEKILFETIGLQET